MQSKCYYPPKTEDSPKSPSFEKSSRLRSLRCAEIWPSTGVSMSARRRRRPHEETKQRGNKTRQSILSYFCARRKRQTWSSSRWRPDQIVYRYPSNKMADDCSRLWHLSDAELLEYFNLTYPQAVPWQIRDLSPAMQHALNSALLCKRAPPEALDGILRPVDKSDAGFPQGWGLPVSAASRGLHQRLYEQFATRPKSWTDRQPAPSQC